MQIVSVINFRGLFLFVLTTGNCFLLYAFGWSKLTYIIGRNVLGLLIMRHSISYCPLPTTWNYSPHYGVFKGGGFYWKSSILSPAHLLCEQSSYFGCDKWTKQCASFLLPSDHRGFRGHRGPLLPLVIGDWPHYNQWTPL